MTKSNKAKLKKLNLLLSSLEDCVNNGDVDMQKEVDYSLTLLEEYLNNEWVNKIKGETNEFLAK